MNRTKTLPLPVARKAYAARIPRGKVIGKRWRIVRKLGEGGFGAVYKVEDINTNEYGIVQKETKVAATFLNDAYRPSSCEIAPMAKFTETIEKSGKIGSDTPAALKAEANRERGSVLRLEAMILKRLAGKPHVAQLLQTGKKDTYSYIVMTLLGDSLDNVLRRIGKICTVSTQVRIGINILFGIKQIHDVGFIHRDLKPANVALGHRCSPQSRFLHIFDFGLAREYIVIDVDGKTKMRRPRPYVHFRGTIRYCSANVQERGEQGRMDDLWCLLYIMAELRGPLPWARVRDRNKILRLKKDTELDQLLENCPVELIPFAEHISTLNYYLRPDYAFLYHLLEQVMTAGRIRFTDPYDWEQNATMTKDSNAGTSTPIQSEERKTASQQSSYMGLPPRVQVAYPSDADLYNPFPAEFFSHDPLGF